jgi:hypothetical protein
VHIVGYQALDHPLSQPTTELVCQQLLFVLVCAPATALPDVLACTNASLVQEMT